MTFIRTRAGFSAAIFALASSFALSSPSAAAGLLQSASPADVQAAGQGSTMGNLVLRSRIARLDIGELARHVAPLNMDTAPDRIERARALDGIISIELFPGTTAIFKRKSVEEIGDSGYAWVGQVNGSPLNYASLIVENGEVTGHIQLAHRVFQIEPLSNGLYRVTELDQSKFPPDDPPGRHIQDAPAQRLAPENPAAPRAKTQVRVLIAYTTAARNAAGGSIKMTAQIKQAVSLANIGYSNTGIPLQVVLAKIMPAGTYVEQSDIAVDLNRLDGSSPGFLANVRAQRELVKADLVSLFRKSDPNFCGIGNLTDHPGAATKNFAYHVMNWTCISNLSFHHEMGHNMGLRHDYYVDPTPGVRYNHGYVNRTAQCLVRTVMAYNNDCVDHGTSCTRINAFSTGAFVYGTNRCKIGIKKSGTLKRMDNTQRLKETRATIGNYRN